MKTTLLCLALAGLAFSAQAQDAKPPLKILLITGGCCHDYEKQKDILKKGIEARVNAEVTQLHSPDRSTKPPLAFFGNADYGQGYDVIVHNECAADISDPKVIDSVLAPHRDGIPGVNLHCAMHSYRSGDFGRPQAPGSPEAKWFDYLGVQSSAHGAQLPITIRVLDEKNPITSSLIGWVTGKEELYNNLQVITGQPLARGQQGAADQPGVNDSVVVWANEYGPKKTRVFSTTIGHNNATVEDPKYLDLVARGILWAAAKLEPGGQPAKGYEPPAKPAK